MKKETIAPWHETKFIVLSSCFFLFPVLLALSYEFYLYGSLLTTCAIASANYWRHAISGFRRNMDFLVAAINFSYFSHQGGMSPKFFWTFWNAVVLLHNLLSLVCHTS